jgi:hypothetical protein
MDFEVEAKCTKHEDFSEWNLLPSEVLLLVSSTSFSPLLYLEISETDRTEIVYIWKIFSKIPAKDLTAVCCVSKLWNYIGTDNSLWEGK